VAENGAIVGYVLSGSSTSRLVLQLTAEGERLVREGMLVAAGGQRGPRVVARVEALRPVNPVFSESDDWVLARRQGRLPRLLRDQGYVVAEAAVLGAPRPGSGLGEPGLPPWPGEPVVLLGPGELREMLGLSEDEPGVVWYGELLGYRGLGVPLQVENITMHLGVFGETGSGKSYAVGALLEALSRVPLGGGEYAALPAMVVDANGDYLDYYEAYVAGAGVGEYRGVVRYVFPSSPARFRPYTRVISISLDGFTAREIAEFIVAYKTGGFDLNELQVSLIERALRELEGAASPTELLTSKISLLYEAIEELSRGHGAVFHPQTGRAAKAAVEKLHQDLARSYRILSPRPSLDQRTIDEATEKPLLVILDFSPEGAPGVPLPLRQLVIAYLARLLYQRFTAYKTRGLDRYMLFVIEEAQNYAPNPRTYPVAWSIARDYLALIATQGRKFGISMAVVSQRPSFLDPVVLSMINTFIVHRSAPDDVAYISRAAGGLPQGLRERLTRLPRGTALVAGQMNLLGHPVLIRTPRRSAGHRMGSTRLIEALRRMKRGAADQHAQRQ
jgi:DNA helicase HerA-like ATPase